MKQELHDINSNVNVQVDKNPTFKGGSDIPVAYRVHHPSGYEYKDWHPSFCSDGIELLYTSPQYRELSDKEIIFIMNVLLDSLDDVHDSYLKYKSMYEKIPTRQARVDGYKQAYLDHQKAIEMLQAILERHGIK